MQPPCHSSTHFVVRSRLGMKAIDELRYRDWHKRFDKNRNQANTEWNKKCMQPITTTIEAATLSRGPAIPVLSVLYALIDGDNTISKERQIKKMFCWVFYQHGSSLHAVPLLDRRALVMLWKHTTAHTYAKRWSLSASHLKSFGRSHTSKNSFEISTYVTNNGKWHDYRCKYHSNSTVWHAMSVSA